MKNGECLLILHSLILRSSFFIERFSMQTRIPVAVALALTVVGSSLARRRR